MNNDLAPLCGAGLALVPIPSFNGKPTKAPRKGWNKPRSAKNPGGYSSNADDFIGCDGFNFGIHHGASNTLALDLDNIELACRVFEELTDLNLLDWLENELRVEIKSPKPNRGKLLFKLPAGFKAPGVKQAKKPKPGKPNESEVIFELRCGDGAQDVIIGEHPDYPGQNYQFVGNPAAIPEAPEVLLDMLTNWDDWKPCIDSALGIEQTPTIIAPRKPQKDEHLPGRRDPIKEFNQSYSGADVLIRNGYKPVGRDRFIRPGSESKAPGAAILRNCKDGVERIYSHGGDVLNDGFAHDSFDCYRLLECDGDFNKALAWNHEINKHNQRLWQEQVKNTTQATFLSETRAVGEKPLFPLKRACELTEKPVSIDWLLEGFIERQSLNLLFGEPGAGKSLFALNWAFCIAAGIDWHEYQTKSADVVIIAGEGHSGMGRRLKALEQKYQMKAPDRLFISERPANLIDATNTDWVTASIQVLCPQPGLVIVDTMHRNMDGDENSSQDIGKFISNLDNFFKPLGAAVLVVHHTGHMEKNRGRGSSSIRAAMDAEFCAALFGGGTTLSCTKSKDFDAPKPMQFVINTVELTDWLDDEGEPLHSVYLEYSGEAKPDKAKKRNLTARDDAILTSLFEAIAAHGIEPPAEIKAKYGGLQMPLSNDWRKVAHVDHWREKAYPRVDVDTPDAKQKAFKRCRDKLFELGKVMDFDGYWWPIYD